MKNALYISIISMLALACAREETCSVVDDDCRVYIAASLQDDVHTKLPYVPTDDADTQPDVPTNDNPLRTEVWASSVSRQFQDRGLDGTQYDPIKYPGVPYEVSYHTVAHFQSGGPQLLSEVIYSKIDTPPIYFVAMTPNSGWQTTDGTVAVYQFNGCEDVMFAPQVEGSYGKKDAYGNPLWPTLHFRHLLTWLRLEIKAESEEVADVWGKLTDIRIACKNQVSIDLSQEYSESCVTFSGESDMCFYAKGQNEIYPAAGGEAIPYQGPQEVAYVLCSPVMALAEDVESDERVPEYVLNITTERRNVSVPVDLKTGMDSWFEDSTMGKQFTISLTFRMGNSITTGVTVRDWVTGGLAGGDLYE